MSKNDESAEIKAILALKKQTLDAKKGKGKKETKLKIESETEVEKEPEISEEEQRKIDEEKRKQEELARKRKEGLAEQKRQAEEARRIREEQEKQRATLLEQQRLEQLVLSQVEKITEKKLVGMREYYEQKMLELEKRIADAKAKVSKKLWQNLQEVKKAICGELTISIGGNEKKMATLNLNAFRSMKDKSHKVNDGGLLEEMIKQHPEKEQLWRWLSRCSRIGSTLMDEFLSFQSETLS